MKYLFKIFHIACFSMAAFNAYADLRDPTRPPDLQFMPITQQGPLELSAIIISNERRIAIINGAPVKIGDQLYGSKVTAIDVNTVQLEGVNGRITLFLLGNPVKQDVEGATTRIN